MSASDSEGVKTPSRSPRRLTRLCKKASIPGRDTDASGSASYLNLVNRPDDDVRVTEATPRRPRSARKPSNASRRTPASVPSSSDDSEVEVLTTASLKRRRSKRLRGQHPHDSDGDSQAMVSPTVKEPNSLRVDKPSDLTPRTPLRHLRKSSKAPPVIPDSDEDDNEPGQQNLVGGTSRVLALDHRPEKHAEVSMYFHLRLDVIVCGADLSTRHMLTPTTPTTRMTHGPFRGLLAVQRSIDPVRAFTLTRATMTGPSSARGCGNILSSKLRGAL